MRDAAAAAAPLVRARAAAAAAADRAVRGGAGGGAAPGRPRQGIPLRCGHSQHGTYLPHSLARTLIMVSSLFLAAKAAL